MTKLVSAFRELFESALKTVMLNFYAKHPCIGATVNALNVPLYTASSLVVVEV
jgi:hypothetical protein